MSMEDKDRHSSVLTSAHDGTALAFSEHSGGYYRVSLSGPSVRGSCVVYASEPAAHLGGFFRDLAMNWRGWQGKKEWSSLEGELSFSAMSDSKGHASVTVRL